MATVYLAIQENFQREVALKVMSPLLSQDESFSERFLREARIVSRLVHPHIVTVHDVGIQNGHHYLSMEYIEGQDLKERLPSLNSEQLFRIVAEIAKALDYAGRKGYVHRDVKPENIMIHNLDGRAVLMDFGIARAADSASTMTRTGTALGTPHYMSPEQARGDAIDSRSDLYSLGVLIYYMLAGKVPYEAESPVAVGIKHVSAPIPVLPSALADYQYLIDKLMAKNPDDRYQTGSELVQALSLVKVDALDKWRPTQGFEYLGSHEHTPLRSDQVKIVTGSNLNPSPESSAETEVLVKAAAKAEPKSEHSNAEESVHIPQEDLQRPRPANKQQWLFALPVVAALIFAAYMYSVRDNEVPVPIVATPAPAAVKGSSPSESVREKPAIEQEAIDEPVEQSGTAEPVAVELDAEPQIAEMTVVEVDSPQLAAEVSSDEASLAVEEEAISVEALEVTEAPENNVAELLAVAAVLQADIDHQPSKTPELTSLYQQILAQQPGEPTASAGMATLKEGVLAAILMSLESGQNTEARSRLDNALVWFPSLSIDDEFQRLEQQLQQAEQISQLLAQAQSYLARDRLIQPEEQNAKALFEQVLVLEPANTQANKGLDNIAKRYGQLATVSMDNQQFDKAESLLGNGFSVRPDDLALRAIQDRLKTVKGQEPQIQTLLAAADQLSAQQQWFGAEPNAVAKYQEVLALQPKRRQAIEALAAIEVQALVDSRELMEAGDINAAMVKSEAALSVFPNNVELQALLQQLATMGPVISNMLLSRSAITDLDAAPNVKTNADRTLHIGFHYSNFSQEASVLQAVLFDGARSVQVAAAPVVLIGHEGKMQFRFERPVEGFTEGGYHLDLLMAGERIFTLAFVIDNK